MNASDRKRAEKVLEAVLAKYPEARELEGWNAPQIIDYDGTPIVSWEMGPYEWALRFGMGGVNWDLYHAAKHDGIMTEKELLRLATEEPTDLPGIFVEPQNSFSLAVYED